MSSPSATTTSGAPAELDKGTRNRVWIGSLSGSSVEWFDFFLYAAAASLIFNVQFFPSDDPATSQLISFISLSITFFVRPIGGIVFAHIGDRVGRKKTLVITIAMMGVSTVAIGLLPNYDQVGILAPILLVICRIFQGLAIGGEWGGALLLAYEYAPPQRRGLFGSIPQMGVTIGLLLATLAFAAVTSLPGTMFEDFAWRIPFIASIILVLIGLWIRSGLGETPAFLKAKQTNAEPEKLPLAEVFKHHWRSVLVAAGAKAVETGPFYLFSTFIVAYATQFMGFGRTMTLTSVAVGAAVSTALCPIFGKLSDKYGRRPVFILGATLIGLMAFPFFGLLDFHSNTLLFLSVLLAFGICWTPVTATLGTLMSEMFDARIRYTGVSLGYQIGAALVGGTMPALALLMLQWSGDHWWPISAYVVLIVIVGISAVLISPRVTRFEVAKLREKGYAPEVDGA